MKEHQNQLIEKKIEELQQRLKRKEINSVVVKETALDVKNMKAYKSEDSFPKEI